MKIQKNRHTLFKTITWLLGSLLFLLLTLVFVLSTPTVQTFLAKKSATYLSQKTGYTIKIDRLAIKWFDELDAKGVYVFDKRNKHLFDIKSLSIDYKLFKFWKAKELELDYACLDTPNFTVGYVLGDDLITFSRFVKDLRAVFYDSNKKKKKPILPFVILKGKVINGTFTYFNDKKNPSGLNNYFDYNFFTLDSIYGDISNFRVYKDTTTFVGKGVKANHTASNLKLLEVNSDFLYCNKSMIFSKLDAKIGDSYIKDSLAFTYDKPSAFSNFNDSVKIIAKIRQSTFSSKDIGIIIPSIGNYKDVWHISTDFSGYVSDFVLRNTSLNFGQSSKLNGRMAFEGLPNVKEMFMDLNLKDSKIIPRDVRQYVQNELFYKKSLLKLGEIDFKAKFNGYTNNFVSNGEFKTQLGFVKTDVNFVLNEKNYNLSKYSGEVMTKNFQLGKLFDEQKLGKADLALKIEPGSYGFSAADAKIDLIGNVKSVQFDAYTYKNIHLDASLAKNIFIGDLTINDPNLTFNGLGNINFNKKETKFLVDGTLRKMNFKALGLSNDPIELSGNMDINLNDFDFNTQNKTFDLDKLIGRISLDSVHARILNENYAMVNIDFESNLENNYRTLKMVSNFLDAKLVGEYNFADILRDFPVLVKEYVLFFENNPLKIANHYKNKDRSFRDYNINLSANLKDIQGLVSLLNSDIELSNNTKIDAQLNRGSEAVFNFKSKPDYFRYKNYEFFENEIDITSSKLIDSSQAKATVYLKSKTQKINGKSLLEESDLLVNVDKQNVGFVLKSNQHESDNYLLFKGDAAFLKDSLLVTFNNSYLHLLQKDWKIDDDNKITIGQNHVNFKDISFINDFQLLSINGSLSNSKQDLLSIRLKDFDIRNLQSLTSVSLGGLVSGDFKLTNAFESPELKSRLFIDDFALLGDTLGQIKGSVDWISKDKDLKLDIDFIKDNLVVTHIKGDFFPEKVQEQLDLDFTADNAEFSILEPFMLGYAKNFKGKIDGLVHLSGTIKQPSWKGKMDVTKAGFMIDYFKTYYEFEHTLLFDKEGIYVENLVLKDTLWKTKATLQGGIKHHWFNNFSANASIKLKNTFVLNTSSKDNILYYGSAFGTGDVFIDGPFSNLKIWSKELTSNTGTKIYVPLEEPDNLSRKEYIQFITKEEKVQIKKKKVEKDFNVSGVDMDINFNITKDAEFEIIFDANAGDVIKGTGEGQLNLKVDTRGDFNLFGTYEFNQGSYNFTLVDLINKKFDIQKGSAITWNGDPYLGELSLDAVYQQFTSLKVFAPKEAGDTSNTNSAQTNPDLQRKVPVEIHLGLSGKLLSPEVLFNVEIKNYPSSLESLVAEITTKLQNDDQFRNKQVFSLIVLKQFSPEENIGSLGSGVTDNLSELFSNQFSSWVSHFDENLNVAIDLSGYNSEEINNFRLKLEYSLLDGRLRVSRDGSFTNLQTSNELANVFGEWTIEYLITDDGKIRMKAFNRNSTVSGLNADNAMNTTYGLSLTHNKSFDSFRELFKNNNNTKQID